MKEERKKDTGLRKKDTRLKKNDTTLNEWYKI